MGRARHPGADAALIGVVATMLAAASNARASPQDLFGFGPRSGAMGMGGPASAEGYEATYGSPALLAETRRRSLVLGWQVARHALRADATGDAGARPLTLPTDEMQAISIGAALPIPFGGALADRVTFGLAFLEPARFLVRARILYPERLQYPIVAPRVQSLAIILGLGARIGDRLYVGAGYEALATVVGRILIAVDSTGRVGSRTDDQVIAAYAPIASVAYDVADKWRVGFTFRGELVGRFVITLDARELGLDLPVFNVAGLAQYDPMQLAAEVRWCSTGNRAAVRYGAPPGAAWRAVAGVLARRWSKYPGPTEPTVLENREFGTGSPPVGASDTLSPRIGIERSLPLNARAGLHLRAGYAFEPTPLPEQTGKENLLDSTRHVFTAGLGLSLGEWAPIQVDLFAQVHFLQSRTHTKTAEVTASTGTRAIEGGGTVAVFGMTAGVSF